LTAERWFLAFDALITFHFAVNLEELKEATPGVEKAVKNCCRMAHAKACLTRFPRKPNSALERGLLIA
jgi:hypothetical protein